MWPESHAWKTWREWEAKYGSVLRVAPGLWVFCFVLFCFVLFLAFTIYHLFPISLLLGLFHCTCRRLWLLSQKCLCFYNILTFLPVFTGHCTILGEGDGTPLQYSCLENPMGRGAWWAAVHGVARVGHDWATSLSPVPFMHWRRKWQPTSVFLPGESQGRGSLVGCSPWGRTESDTTEAT